MRLINYKMTLQYEGTRYRGWQKQPGAENTIQGKLETVLSRLLDTQISVYGAGRTDAGVHALGQCASFRVSEDNLKYLSETFPRSEAGHGILGGCQGNLADMGVSGDTPGYVFENMYASQQNAFYDMILYRALNHYLPEDIAAIRLSRASDRFHARYLTSSKWYRYRIRTNPVSDVFNRRFLWQYGSPLDTGRMMEGAGFLTGRHDFASFCGLKMKKSTVRTVTGIEITRPDEDNVVLDFRGDGFLNHMVRLMTGELVDVGAGRIEPEEIGRILEMRCKGAADRTAPASGLTLMEVSY